MKKIRNSGQVFISLTPSVKFFLSFIFLLAVFVFAGNTGKVFRIGDKVYIFSEKREFAYTNKKSTIIDIYENNKGEKIYKVLLYNKKFYIYCEKDEIYYE